MEDWGEATTLFDLCPFWALTDSYICILVRGGKIQSEI